ncbi:MAG: hypothetical protein ACTMIR_16230, partial [Cellulomonadaceae bacterium]
SCELVIHTLVHNLWERVDLDVVYFTEHGVPRVPRGLGQWRLGVSTAQQAARRGMLECRGLSRLTDALRSA